MLQNYSFNLNVICFNFEIHEARRISGLNLESCLIVAHVLCDRLSLSSHVLVLAVFTHVSHTSLYKPASTVDFCRENMCDLRVFSSHS